MFKFNFRNTKIRAGSIRTYDILVLLEWMIRNVWNVFNDKNAKTTSMKTMSSHISENWWKRQKYVGITDMIIDTQARFFSIFFVFSQGDSLTNPILVTAFQLFGPVGHRSPSNLTRLTPWPTRPLSPFSKIWGKRN